MSETLLTFFILTVAVVGVIAIIDALYADWWDGPGGGGGYRIYDPVLTLEERPQPCPSYTPPVPEVPVYEPTPKLSRSDRGKLVLAHSEG